jgi:hypothetical protein
MQLPKQQPGAGWAAGSAEVKGASTRASRHSSQKRRQRLSDHSRPCPQPATGPQAVELLNRLQGYRMSAQGPSALRTAERSGQLQPQRCLLGSAGEQGLRRTLTQSPTPPPPMEAPPLPRADAWGFLVGGSLRPKTPEHCPRVHGKPHPDEALVLSEAAGVGAWGRTFQVWAPWFSWGTCGDANGVSISQAHRLRSLLLPD